jgi:hypothetical protein
MTELATNRPEEGTVHAPDAHSHATRTRRAIRWWPACASLLLVLAACTPAPGGGSLTASAGGEPSLTGGQGGEASASESASASPASSESGTLSGNWTGTWTIDPPYSGEGGFTMEITQTSDSFSGTVELTNSDCGDGTVNGTVNGTSVTFGWVTTKQPIQFSGTLNGTSSMSGTWSSVACSDSSISLTGTWAATKVVTLG